MARPGLLRLLPLGVGIGVIASAFGLAAVLGDGESGPFPASDFGSGDDELLDWAYDSFDSEPLGETSEVVSCGADSGGGVPAVSHESGFYDDPILLEVAAPEGSAVYYTLDGSPPDLELNSATVVYVGPVLVTDRTGSASSIAAIRTSVFGLESAADFGDGTWDIAPPGMHQATVVRIRAEGGAECAAVYFVGGHLRRGLSVMHLALDPSHLFDHETGIYVPGAHFEARADSFDPGAWWRTRGNYSLRGRTWERPFEDDVNGVVLHYFDASGDLGYVTKVGVRIHGGVSRSFPQKSLRLYARNAYGNRLFEYSFFGDEGPDVHRRLILRNSGNDCLCGSPRGLHLVDGFLQGLVSHLPIDTQASQPTVLFINGEYWGIHNLRERYDRHYLAITHGADADNVAILGPRLSVGTGTSADAAEFRRLLDELAGLDASDPAAYHYASDLLDVEDFIDYLLIQVFSSNRDWPHNNFGIWRERVEQVGGPMHARDGRWRWLTYDLDQMDYGWTANGSHNQVGRILFRAGRDAPESNPIAFLFSWFTGNRDFVASFVNRFADHLNTTFLPARTITELDRLVATLRDEMALHVERWAAAYGGSLETWHDSIERLRTFLEVRPAHQWMHLVDTFGLTGTVPVRVRTGVGGMVRVNSIFLTADTPGVITPSDWHGYYFPGVPIELEAIPNPGYRFVRWDGLPSGIAATAVVTVDPGALLHIAPVFEGE